ncbi:hypothetical protein LX36DRAFT_29006 [Colletotrichum falcatum]|nr:hypothetical protein LX36DRAFT_29006 [Colletotrichum falcatum]
MRPHLHRSFHMGRTSKYKPSEVLGRQSWSARQHPLFVRSSLSLSLSLSSLSLHLESIAPFLPPARLVCLFFSFSFFLDAAGKNRLH